MAKYAEETIALIDEVSPVLRTIAASQEKGIQLWLSLGERVNAAGNAFATAASAAFAIATGVEDAGTAAAGMTDAMIVDTSGIDSAAEAAEFVEEMTVAAATATEQLGEAIEAMPQGAESLSSDTGSMEDARLLASGLKQEFEEAMAAAQITFPGITELAQDTAQTLSDLVNLESYWTAEMDTSSQTGLLMTSTLQELIEKGQLYAGVLGDVAAAAADSSEAQRLETEAAEQAAQAAETTALAQERQESGHRAIEEATAAYQTATAALTNGQSAYGLYSKQLKSVESALTSQSQKLDMAKTKYQSLVDLHGIASDEADRQRQVVEDLTDSLKGLTEQQEILNERLEECDPPDDELRENGNRAEKAADQYGKLLSKLTQVAAGFLSLRTAMSLMSDAMSLGTFDLKFQALMGDDVGSSAAAWTRSLALQLGQDVNDVMSSTMNFSKMGFSGAQIGNMSELADRFTWFADDVDYKGMTKSIEQAFRTGRTEGLSSALDLPKSAFEAYGIDKAIKNNDVDGFIAGLEKAAEAAGMTEEALAKITSGNEAQWGQFTNNIVNMATFAAEGFWEAFGPTLEMMNEWLQSDSAIQFFEGLRVVFQVVGAAAGLMAQIIMKVGSWIGENFTTIAMVAGVAALAFAIYLVGVAIAAMAANLPIVLMIALMFAVAKALQSMGVTAGDVFEFIGTLAGGLYAIIYNGVAALYNIIAAFAEFFANVFDDPVGSVMRLFVDIFDSILGIVETVAQAIDKVMNTNMSGAVSGFRDKMKAWVKDEYGDAAIEIERMMEVDAGSIMDEWGAAGRKFGDSIGSIGDLFNGIGGGMFDGWSGTGMLSDIADNTSGMKDKMEISGEDLKYMRDIAEREAINRYTTSEITINQTNNNQIASDMDVDGILTALSDDFAEKMYISAEGVHA